ncbi:MAG: diacylglycerol kinase family protein [Allobaculum sp.]
MAWLKGRFIYAFKGLKAGVLHDRSIRIHVIFAVLVIIVGFIFGLNLREWLWVLLAIALVLSAEIFNSAIEHTVDYISLDRNPQAGLVKDLAAASVFVISIFALIVGLVIFGTHVFSVLERIFC